MRSSTERQDVPGGFIESGTIEHEGHAYTAGGAMVTDTHAVVYLRPDGTCTNWGSVVLGTWRETGRYDRWFARLSLCTIQSVRVRLTDGRTYYGRRNLGWSDAVNLRRYKG